MDVLVKPKITIDLTADPTQINPYPPGVNVYRGGNPPPPQSQLTVISKHVADGSPAKNFNINIQSCTEIGNAATSKVTPDADGHGHDSVLRMDSCEVLDRPFATLQGAANGESANPITLTTDSAGMIASSYTSPHYTNSSDGTSYYISGNDTITAEWEKDRSMKGSATITTKVPGLQQMPSSEECPEGQIGGSFGGSQSYFFTKQPFHECAFYATDETMGALVDLANVYVEKQKECMESPDGLCEITTGSSPSDSRILVGINNVIPLGISSMSLPWGGLYDTNGDWQTPKHFNNDGREVDITWKDQNGAMIDDGHKALLWSIIKADPRWTMPINNLGGDYAATYDNIANGADDTMFHLEYQGGFPIS